MSKTNVEKVETPCREYIKLRSMSRQPPPPYKCNDNQRFTNSHDFTTKKQNGLNNIRLEEENNAQSIIIRDECVKFRRCRHVIYGITGLLMFLTCVIVISLVFPYPLHASCLIKWKFGDPCVYTMQKFRCQILNWSSCTNCEQYDKKCLYTLNEPKPYESNVIRAVHLAPNLRTVEKIKITFDEINKTCVATGVSVSTEWFRIFDYGTNYCNLHNLVTGIGFDKNPKFLELTTNEVCTQYNMAVCK